MSTQILLFFLEDPQIHVRLLELLMLITHTYSTLFWLVQKTTSFTDNFTRNLSASL